MNSKITKQDVAAGRIYRCSVCDAKCDDTWYSGQQQMVCGRYVKIENTLLNQCSQDCHYKHMRDEGREVIECKKQFDERYLPTAVEGLKIALKEGYECASIMFKTVKHTKMRIKLLTRFLSRQMTLAEIQAEFYTLSRFEMEIAEDWLEYDPDDETDIYMEWVNKSGWASQFVEGGHSARAWSVDYC